MSFWNKNKNNQNEKTAVVAANGVSATDKNSDKFLAVVKNLTDGILVFDEKNQVSFINPEAEKIFKVQSKDIIGQSFIRLSSFPYISSLISFLGGGIKETYREEFKLGDESALEITSLQMVLNDKKIGSMIIIHDVTQEKLVERTRTEFITLAAHQLRTPTSGIKWSLRMMLDGDLGEISDKQKEVAETAYQTNEKVISLINDLLSIVKIEEGKFLSEMTLGSLEELIRTTVSFYKNEINEKKLKIDFNEPKEKLPDVLMDASKMKMAVENIFENAIRYNINSGKIIISMQEAGLTEKGEKEILVSVKDTGIGIPEERRKDVFNKFFRAENALRAYTEGSGLGLFIAKHIIEAHGGRIWFESENEGTTFYFAVPIRKSLSEYLSKPY